MQRKSVLALPGVNSPPPDCAIWTTEDTLWLREGGASAFGAFAGRPVGSETGAGFGAASGDLGYTPGGSEEVHDKGVDIRVWQYRSPDGRKLLADLSGAIDPT